MSKELIVSAGRHETRVAILEDDQVAELFIERDNEYSLAGSIHKGKVTRVLPGMQSAFVDIGLERDAFLYVSDFFEDHEEYDAVVSGVEDKVLKMEDGERSERTERPERSERPERNDRNDRDRGRGRGRDRGRDRDRNRPRRPEQLSEQPVAAAPSEATAEETDPNAVAPETDTHIESAEAAAPETQAEGTTQPQANQEQRRDRDGRDRDGRGRGRRRRGRGRGGLPESKFAPREDRGPRPEGRGDRRPDDRGPRHEPRPEQRHEPRESAPPSGDFAVLPGETLSKYRRGDSRSESVAEPIDPADALFEPEDPQSEHAAPVFAAVSEPEAEGSEGEGEGLSATEVAEDELVAEAAQANEVAESPSEEEGPEPARIPTSLTARLREQGQRYPHRTSRRMRRKMRAEAQSSAAGEPPVENEDPSEEVAASEDAAPIEGATPVEVSAEGAAPVEGDAPVAEAAESTERPRHEGRGDRDRGGRDRGDRGHRGDRGGRDRDRDRERSDRPPLPSISDLLKPGQEIVVQIAKEPLGQKGARITSHIALPGRFVVYMPTVEHVGVSRKIPSDDERHRLKKVLQTHRQGMPGGFICRTAASDRTEEELSADMHFLYDLWLDMRQKAESKPAPQLLHHDLNVVQRILRDQLTATFKTIWVDNEELYESVLKFVERFQPALVGRVKLYTRPNPIFDEFGVTAEIDKALRPKVWLKSGGYIVINQTEALVAIDINTGKYVGKSNRLEDTIVKVNTDAIKEIVRQIRLRDLGGIIVVDFIDMDERKNRQKVMQALEEAMRVDRAPYKILQFNDFGLVAITRKRVKQSLERALCAPCQYCEGAGYVKNVQTVITEIQQEAMRMQKALREEEGNVMLRVNPEVAKLLKNHRNNYLQEIEEIVGRAVLVKSDPLLHQTKFDLA